MAAVNSVVGVFVEQGGQKPELSGGLGEVGVMFKYFLGEIVAKLFPDLAFTIPDLLREIQENKSLTGVNERGMVYLNVSPAKTEFKKASVNTFQELASQVFGTREVAMVTSEELAVTERRYFNPSVCDALRGVSSELAEVHVEQKRGDGTDCLPGHLNVASALYLALTSPDKINLVDYLTLRFHDFFEDTDHTQSDLGLILSNEKFPDDIIMQVIEKVSLLSYLPKGSTGLPREKEGKFIKNELMERIAKSGLPPLKIMDTMANLYSDWMLLKRGETLSSEQIAQMWKYLEKVDTFMLPVYQESFGEDNDVFNIFQSLRVDIYSMLIPLSDRKKTLQQPQIVSSQRFRFTTDFLSPIIALWTKSNRGQKKNTPII